MYKQHIVQQFTDVKSPFNLKTELKKLIFEGGKPQVICEDPAIFTMVISTFTQYEKYVSGLKTVMPSLVPRPHSDFNCLQYGKAERAWYLFSCE